jgi:hypothetical protein
MNRFVIGFLKQKQPFFMIRSLEIWFLYFIVFYCHDQPITKPVIKAGTDPNHSQKNKVRKLDADITDIIISP